MELLPNAPRSLSRLQGLAKSRKKKRARVRGGTIHGATDELGMHSVENICTMHDLHATILHLLGLDHERLTFRFSGRDFRLTDVHRNVVREVLA